MRPLSAILEYRIEQEQEVIERNNHYLAQIATARILTQWGYTQREIACAMGISQSRVRQLVNAYL